MKQRKTLIFSLAVIGALAATHYTLGGRSDMDDQSDDDSSILGFRTMAPVTGPYVGTNNPIRGIPGGGLPWIISSAGACDAETNAQTQLAGARPSSPENSAVAKTRRDPAAARTE